MKTFLPTLFALLVVAVIIGVLFAVGKLIDSHYDYKVKHGQISEEEAAKKKSSGIKTALIIVGVVLALAYVTASNYGAVKSAHQEGYEEGYDKGYADGYSDAESDYTE